MLTSQTLALSAHTAPRVRKSVRSRGSLGYGEGLISAVSTGGLYQPDISVVISSFYHFIECRPTKPQKVVAPANSTDFPDEGIALVTVVLGHDSHSQDHSDYGRLVNSHTKYTGVVYSPNVPKSDADVMSNR